MTWSVPSLEDIAERTRTAFSTYLPGADARVFPSNVYASAKVIAGRVWELFLRQEFIALQAFPLTAVGLYLERHAQAYGISRHPAAQGTGELLITGGTAGTEVPIGSQYQTSDGRIYETTASVDIDSAGQATLPVQTLTASQSLDVEGGASMTALFSVTGIPATATVASNGLQGGTAIESDADLRIRLLARIRFPPHAGTEADYISWAKSIPGVTRAWAAGSGLCPGGVVVYFAMDDLYDNGIPTATDVATVQAYINTLAPITANVSVLAPTPDPINIQITGLSPLKASVVTAIGLELQQMFRDKAQVSTLNDTQFLRASWIWQAVSNATGENYHTLSVPASDYQIAIGALPIYDVNQVQIT